MSNFRVGNKVVVLKQDSVIAEGFTLPANTEIEVVMDVVYMQGVPVVRQAQDMMIDWIAKNPKMYTEKTTY